MKISGRPTFSDIYFFVFPKNVIMHIILPSTSNNVQRALFAVSCERISVNRHTEKRLQYIMTRGRLTLKPHRLPAGVAEAPGMSERGQAARRSMPNTRLVAVLLLSPSLGLGSARPAVVAAAAACC